MKLANIQHLYTPIKASLPPETHILDVVEGLHPTPALGGQPRAVALDAIARLEPVARGWYGAPVGWRLAVAHPDRVTALVSQNGNAYEEGLAGGWAPIQKYWKDPSNANREALRDFLTADSIK